VGAPLVVIDYAHTPDALEQVLRALRPMAAARGGRLVVVFGAGGERDRAKRAPMGAAAARHADRIVLTSDNPRGEDPLAILREIEAGVDAPHALEPDRAHAIDAAIDAAAPADVVLLAGKGHEATQEIGGRRLPFSDAEVARAALARRENR
jgi:UDP-N-acetylmuramyl tripeptide synthase